MLVEMIAVMFRGMIIFMQQLFKYCDGFFAAVCLLKLFSWLYQALITVCYVAAACIEHIMFW